MKWGIVTDSSSDLVKSDFNFEDIELEIVPLSVMAGDRVFVDCEDPDIDEFLEYTKKYRSSSACPSPDDFKSAFEKHDNIICICMTGTLSGTYGSACLAAKLLKEEHPEKNIKVINSYSTAGAMVLTAEKAVELIEIGCDFETVAKRTEEYCHSLELVFTLSSYDNLINNGRMNPFIGAVATHLGIRAVAVKTKEGEISVSKKVRGENKVLETMVDIMRKKKPPVGSPVSICHCKNPEMAQKLADMIKTAFSPSEIKILACKMLTSYYAMRGGVIVAY